MLEFVKKHFAKVFEISLTLSVIIFIITGGIFGFIIAKNIILVIIEYRKYC